MNKQTRVSQLLMKAAEVNRGDTRRIRHVFKVCGYAKAIGEMEGLDEETQFILESAAALHDIGIQISQIKYHSAAGKYQELEGPIIARPILEALDYTPKEVERILYLIGHHHTYTHIEGQDYRILVEADFLVNLDNGMPHSDEEKRAAKKTIFRTPAALFLFDQLFPDLKDC